KEKQCLTRTITVKIMIGSKMSSWIFVAFLLSPFILPEIQCDPVAAMLVDNMYGIRGRMNNLRNNVEPQIMGIPDDLLGSMPGYVGTYHSFLTSY
ncbi:hypothetical protein TNCT_694371, partial [Trichonephila clavata]